MFKVIVNPAVQPLSSALETRMQFIITLREPALNNVANHNNGQSTSSQENRVVKNVTKANNNRA